MGTAEEIPAGLGDLVLGGVWVSGERERWSGNLAQHTLPLAFRSLEPSALGKKERTCLLSSLCPTQSPCQYENRELYPCAPSPDLSPASKSPSALLCPQTGGPSPLGCCTDGLNKTAPQRGGPGWPLPHPTCSPLPSASPLLLVLDHKVSVLH